MLALCIAAIVGVGTTWTTTTRGTELGTLTIGAWTARPRTGTADIDPYSRATITRNGELPIGAGDGIAFTARADDRNRRLDGRCDVVVSGVTPPARFWTLTLYDGKGHLVANSLQRYGFTSEEVVRSADGTFEIHIASRARAGNRRAHGGLLMIRLAFPSAAGVLLGLVVHLVSVLALPKIASQDAYSRLTPLTKLNAVTQLPLADPANTLMPYLDPAFAEAICRYDLLTGPIKLKVPVSQAYTSVSFYTRNELAYYAINDRSAGKKVIELDLMTEAQHNDLPEDEEIASADRLIIDSPSSTGLIVIKALAPEPGLMPQAQASLAASHCRIQAAQPAKQAATPA